MKVSNEAIVADLGLEGRNQLTATGNEIAWARRERKETRRDCKFLGYTIGGKGQLRISKESKARMTDRLKALTKRNQGREFGAVIREINAFLR